MKRKCSIYLPSLRLCLAAVVALSSAAYGDVNSPSVQLGSFSLSTSSLIASGNKSTTLNAQWSVSAANSPSGYFVSAHIFPASSSERTPTDSNRFLQRNCNPVMGSCDEPHNQPCTFNNRKLSCSAGTSVTLMPGTYSIIGRACVVDAASTNLVCSLKESSLVIQP